MFLDTSKYDKYRPAASGHDLYLLVLYKTHLGSLVIVVEIFAKIATTAKNVGVPPIPHSHSLWLGSTDPPPPVNFTEKI